MCCVSTQLRTISDDVQKSLSKAVGSLEKRESAKEELERELGALREIETKYAKALLGLERECARSERLQVLQGIVG